MRSQKSKNYFSGIRAQVCVEKKEFRENNCCFFSTLLSLRRKSKRRINLILFSGGEQKKSPSFQQKSSIIIVDAAYLRPKTILKKREAVFKTERASKKDPISVFLSKYVSLVFEGRPFHWYFFFECLSLHFWNKVLKSVFLWLFSKKKRTYFLKEKNQWLFANFFQHFWRNLFFCVKVTLIQHWNVERCVWKDS